MQIFITVLVTFIAGAGAGLGTGFAGMSAAAVIVPLLTTFLGVDFNMAVGIALASDVLASAVSAATYGKNKNLDIKNGLVMMAFVLAFTVLGSYVSSLLPSTAMGGFSVIITLFLGIRFIVKPVMTTKEAMLSASKAKRITGSVVGGGMMMLLVLTAVLGYELKTAVGTSVFIMTFTAVTGAASHFILGGTQPDWLVLGLCVGFTFMWAQIAAVIANKVSPQTLNRVLGSVLAALGIVILTFNLIK